jgi:general secretion pathway protein D
MSFLRLAVFVAGAALVAVAALGQQVLSQRPLAERVRVRQQAPPPPPSAERAEAIAVAQATPRDARAPREQARTINLDFQDAPLTDVIKTVAELTGKNFLFDDRVRGNVTLISPDPLTPDEAYRVFEAILQVKGFTTVPGPGGVLKIVPVRSAKESAIETVPSGRSVPNRDLYITRLIPLRYVKAETISNTLRPLVSKDANLVTYAPTNTIILTDTAAHVRRLLTIIAEIDVSTYREQIKVIPIEYADAESMAAHLREIFGQEDAGDRGAPAARRAAARRRTRQTAQAAAVTDEGGVVGEAGEPRFITDERTNSIIVIAPATTIRRIEEVVSLLDYQRRGTGRIHVYRLQNADAEEMAQTLATLAQGAAPPAAAAGAGAPPAQRAAIAELAGGVQVTADAPTNSLIIQASAEGFSTVRDVIEALDVRRPQVMVEALIMEVDIDDAEAYGGGFLYEALLGGDGEGPRIVVGSRTSVRDDTAIQDVDNIRAIGDFASAIIGKTVTVLKPLADGGFEEIEVPVIQAIVLARGSDQDTNIISAPVILTADNEEAQIVVGQNIPIITSRVQAAEGAPTLSTSNNVERQDVGVTLRVTPQISEGEMVRLDIFQEISEVIQEDPDLGPTTSQRTVENTVYVSDSEAVMIGGIIAERQIETLSKVPFLGDVPILGWAFKSKIETTRKTNLLVILTPHIVRDPSDLERLTVEQRERFRNAARDEMQLSPEEEEARRKAMQAGVDLPLDPNPVRREVEEHEKRYPIEELPELRREREERERERLEQMQMRQSLEGGTFLVQVASFRTTQEAVELLAKLIGQGYDGTVLSRSEQGMVLHVVQLGPYLDQERAHHVARAVRVTTGYEPYVVIEP